ncbi:glycosyl hydrolase [Aeoliella sp. SH292]|uniref:glycosyl hydrolase n=1 Tax=Aeoliella sp. SH292 TaxID=3454464 RepID=UPI003F9A9FB3
MVQHHLFSSTPRTLLSIFVSLTCVCQSPHTMAAEPVSSATSQSGRDVWPRIESDSKPWTYWYWMGGAVDEAGITSHLEQYHKAGLGGVHVIPVYGVQGVEERYVPFLSPRWMELLSHCVDEANRLDMGVDITTGTGWPFGGPWVEPQHVAARFTLQDFSPPVGVPIGESIRPQAKGFADCSLVVLMAYGPEGDALELTDEVDSNGTLKWTAPDAGWKLTALFQTPTGLPVERAAPGGEGPTLDHFSKPAIQQYLRHFDQAFQESGDVRVRSMYNDSYENWGANWTPHLFDEFQRRRGYDLRRHLHQLSISDTSDVARLVRSDYRETIADLIHDDFTTTWVDWAHQRGMKIRNEAHGSPGNPLDLYALADMPETEVFGTGWLDVLGLEPVEGVPKGVGGPPDVLACKLASSAAHVAGRQRCSSETCTWLGDHFKIPLGHMKAQADQMFLMGVNHIFFHGAAYSPADVEWPGWLWYASTNIGPYMPAWRDMPALCNYIARCQAWLQSGQPDNDLLVYLPIYDVWVTDKGERDLLQYTGVHHAHHWIDELMPGFSAAARQLVNRGYTFDCISDRQIGTLTVTDGKLTSAGTQYRAILIPSCKVMPDRTAHHLLRLVDEGATVILGDSPASAVPGLGDRERRQASLLEAMREIRTLHKAPASRAEPLPSGRVIMGTTLESMVDQAGGRRESMVDMGLQFIRRKDAAGSFYFILNRSGNRLETWVPVTAVGEHIVLFDPATAKVGRATTRLHNGKLEFFVQMNLLSSLIVRVTDEPSTYADWEYVREVGSRPLEGPWKIEFLEGGPTLPEDVTRSELIDWTQWKDNSGTLQSFSGVARYTTSFEVRDPAAERWMLDLGDVYHSATVRLNGKLVSQLIIAPYQADITSAVRAGSNLLEIEVANLPANRVAELDRRRVDWKKFLFVDILYQPFDASGWKPIPSGLVGPVTLHAQRKVAPSDLLPANE